MSVINDGVPEPLARRQVSLVDLLDRLLAGGVVIAGDLTLRIADVDLVRIHLRAVIASVTPALPSPFEEALDTALDNAPLPHPHFGGPR